MINTFTCPECDHDHDIEVIRGEYPDDDYCEPIDQCEECGADFTQPYVSELAERQNERRQMGITS